LLQQALIGKWSAYEYNGYGTLEDVVLAFRTDGTGWYAFERDVLCERETFIWEVSPDERVTIKGLTTAVVSEDGLSFEESASRRFFPELKLEVKEETTRWPEANEALVLTFETEGFAGISKFAQVATNPAELALPRFDCESQRV
jgi:hypothetical protein